MRVRVRGWGSLVSVRVGVRIGFMVHGRVGVRIMVV